MKRPSGANRVTILDCGARARYSLGSKAANEITRAYFAYVGELASKRGGGGRKLCEKFSRMLYIYHQLSTRGNNFRFKSSSNV